MADVNNFAHRIRERDRNLTQMIFHGNIRENGKKRARGTHRCITRGANQKEDTSDDLLSRNAFRELMAAIGLHGQYSRIRKVRISRRIHDFLRSPFHSDAEVNFFRFWDMISALPALEEIELTRGDEQSSSMYSEFLVRSLLQRLDDISQLRRIKVSADSSLPHFHVDDVASCLQDATQLEELIVTRVSFGGLQEDSLSPIFSALTTLNKLKTVDLRGVKFASRPLISKDILLAVFRSGTLNNISLVNMGLNNEHAQIIAEELKTNILIERIDISGNWFIDESGYRSILSTMRNQFYVKTFEIGCAPWLRGEYVSGVTISQEQAANSMTKRIPATIASFAKLNAAGRRNIMHSTLTDNSEWIHLLRLVSHDLDALYYLLQTNPELCNRHGSHDVEASKIRPKIPAVAGNKRKKRRKT